MYNMNIKRILRTIAILAILGSTIGCDQVSKSIARQKIGEFEEISLIYDRLTLMKVENKGAFLSIGHALPEPIKTLLLVVFPVVVLTLAVIYLLTKKGLSNLSILGISFVVGGGIGNIYDRIIYGSVTDFLHIDFVIFQTGIFNMADVSVMTGMVLILLEAFYLRMKLDHSMTDPKRGD
jgi:signal peptidase II